jgi:hypothetical protein
LSRRGRRGRMPPEIYSDPNYKWDYGDDDD